MTIKLTCNDYVAQAGLAEAALMGNPPYSWTQMARISTGNRLHGDAMNSDWKALYSLAPEYSTIINQPWTDIVGWIYVNPGINNTCTNAAVLIYDFQMQVFNLSTGKWEIITDPANGGRELVNSTYGMMYDQSITDGAADRIFPNRYNMSGLCCTKNPTDRSSLNPDPAKYRFIHNSMARKVNIDYSIIGGLAVMCRAKLVPVSGSSLNGNPQILMCVAADAYPYPNSAGGTGSIPNIYIMPAILNSAFKVIGTNEAVFLATTAKLTNDVYVNLTSDYVTSRPPGTYPHCMSADLFSKNVPQFITF